MLLGLVRGLEREKRVLRGCACIFQWRLADLRLGNEKGTLAMDGIGLRVENASRREVWPFHLVDGVALIPRHLVFTRRLRSHVNLGELLWWDLKKANTFSSKSTTITFRIPIIIIVLKSRLHKNTVLYKSLLVKFWMTILSQKYNELRVSVLLYTHAEPFGYPKTVTPPYSIWLSHASQ